MVLPQLTFDLVQAYETLSPLAIIIGAITVYGVFVFNFYRFLARKDIFTLDLQKHNQAKHRAMRKTISVVFYIFKFLVLYPVFVFFWFFVMAVLLYLLSRNQPIEVVMLVAMAVVGAIRICSYYKEALSTDISKILPFALLGIMLIDNSIIRLVESTDSVRQAALQWETVISLTYYLGFVVSLELLLRIISGTFNFFRNGRKARKEARGRQPKPEVKQQPVGPQFGAAGTGTVFEPRPVGRGSASTMPSGRSSGMNPRPAFLDGRSGPVTESPESGGGYRGDEEPREREQGHGRPAYASAFSSELPSSNYSANRGYRIG